MKKLLNFKFLIFSLTILLASCSEEWTTDNRESTTFPQEGKSEVEKAKTFFEKQYPGAHMLNLTMGKPIRTRSASESFHSKFVEPNWKKAKITPYNQGIVIETPVKMPGDIYALKYIVNQGVSSHERIRVQTRLVMYQDSKGKTSYRIATIIPDKEYYKNNKDSLKKMSSIVEGTNFTGTVIHSFLNGKMAGGKYYVNGISKYRLRFDNKKKSLDNNHKHGEQCNLNHTNNTRALNNSENRIEAKEFSFSLTLIDRDQTSISYMSDWENDVFCALCGSNSCDGSCNDVVVEPDKCSVCGNYESECICNTWGCSLCGSPYCYGECQLAYCSFCGSQLCKGECQNCPYCGSAYCLGECQDICPYCNLAFCNGECQNNGGDSGGSTGDNNNAGKPYTSNPNDKMAKKKIPTTFSNTQIGGTCVFASMQYVNNMLGGDVNYGAYILQYSIAHNAVIKDVMRDGVLSSNAATFISNNFAVDQFTTFAAAIDNGNVVLTDIYTSQNFTHCVTVVGYHPNGDLIYMDPETGVLEEWQASKCNVTFAIPIKKNK